MTNTVFGESPEMQQSGQEAANNQASEVQQGQKQGQPESNVSQSGNNVNQDQEVNQAQSQDVNQAGEQQKAAQGQDKILGKFDSYDDVAQSLDNLSQKLGKEVDWNSIESEQDLVAAYNAAERELGQTSDKQKLQQELGVESDNLDDLRQTKSKYERQLAQQQQYIQQLSQQMQQLNNQLQNGQQPTQADENQQGQSENGLDPDEWMNEFYEKGPEAVEKLVEQRLQEEKKKQQQIQQKIKQQKMKEQKVKRRYANQVNQLKQKYGDEFDQYRKEAAKVMKERPYYAYMNNGMEYAYLAAKRRASNQMKQQTRQYQQQKSQNQQKNYFKQSAQMPSSNANRVVQQQPNKEEQLKQSIFGDQSGGGIFG